VKVAGSGAAWGHAYPFTIPSAVRLQLTKRNLELLAEDVYVEALGNEHLVATAIFTA